VPEPPLLTVDQLAQRWQVPKSSIWQYTREGRIPGVKIGRYYRYRQDAIEELERNGGMTNGRR
jgi:excisionase family DNA binding protein